MAALGEVSYWSAEEGWGVISSPETPGGCWVHFSAAAESGFRDLEEGQLLEMDYERVEKDGYRFYATRVWSPGVRPDRAEEGGASTNLPVEEELRFTTGDDNPARLRARGVPSSRPYESHLHITFDDDGHASP
ncbi:cold shock domain-containing protein [Arthrobacter crusticola]|uniref:Cold shock domain-containing protein n=1 Tax=Arthrobacter crusticola TaxID=2547960 RepID=A0A4R5TYV1_9MICC|nr:cold shock domain-containing protein [Arthrobacter crusticola]TDK26390.1 cold shock domain-containing protein [Arthrobacter crusticola]